MLLVQLKMFLHYKFFLHRDSKLQSFDDRKLLELLQNANQLYKLATLADLKNIIKWLKTFFRDKKYVKDLKVSGRKYDLFLHLSKILCISPLSMEPKERRTFKTVNSLYSLCVKHLKGQKRLF